MTGLLRHHDFRALLAGAALSSVGSRFLGFALPLFALSRAHADVGQVALITALSTAAFLVVGLPAGAIVDRVRRRRLLIVADAGRAALVASLLVGWGDAQLPVLYVVAAATGVLTVFFDVAHQSYLPQLITRDQLVEGNTRLTTVATIATVAGPTAAGALLGATGVSGTALVIALAFLGSAAFLLPIGAPDARPVAVPGRGIVREVRDGLGLVLRHPVLRLIALSGSLYNLFFLVIQSTVLVYLVSVLGLTPAAAGLYFTAGGAGGVLGAVLSGRIAARIGRHRLLWLGLVTTTPFMVLTPLATGTGGLWAAAAGFLVVSAGASAFNIAQVSVRQEVCPDELLGRMTATMRFLLWSSLPLGSLLGGAVGSAGGVRTALWVGAIGMVLACAPACLPALRKPAVPTPM